MGLLSSMFTPTILLLLMILATYHKSKRKQHKTKMKSILKIVQGDSVER